MFAQPGHQRQIIGEAAHQRHRGVGMQVDEPRNDDVIGQMDYARWCVTLNGSVSWQDIDDHTVCDNDGVMFQYRGSRYDRHDPSCHEQGVCGCRHSRSVKRRSKLRAKKSPAEAGLLI